ncbi:MAG TPA: hypothetical protein H9836_14965 [Candidatus Nocardiopsis merdipullorum]|nr:hypothetical protein [Candidatus Nocardiopsis merdipullorum]
MTERISSAVRACLDWARERRPQPPLDTETLTFLLHAHLDAGAPEPGDWSVDDVHEVARTARTRGNGPTHLRETWLTWCDHLVARGNLSSGVSPRELRKAIASVDLSPKTTPPKARETIDEAARALLRRLGADGDTPEPLPPVVPALPTELDNRARMCIPLADAARLTVWVGDRRPLKTDGPHDQLTAQDTVAAATAMGIDPVRVHPTFVAAREAGLLRTTYTHVLPGPAATSWGQGVPGSVANAWADSLLALGDLRGPTAFLLLTDLFVHGGDRTPADLVAVYGGGENLGVRTAEPEERVREVLAVLEGLGAVDNPTPGNFRITCLGDHFMVRQLNRSGADVPLLPALELMGAGQALDLPSFGRPVDTERVLRGWLPARAAVTSLHTAVGELVEASSVPEAWHRRSRMAELLGLHQELEEVLAFHVHHPVVGGWVRRARGDRLDGPPTEHSQVWALLDEYAMLWERGQNIPASEGRRLAPHAEDVVRAMCLTEHPVAKRVLKLLATEELGPELAQAARTSEVDEAVL